MSYHLGSVAPPTPRAEPPNDERAAGTGEPSGGRARLLARGIASSALVLLVMAAFAGGVWFAHFAGRRHGGAAGNVPLIRADSRPMKVRPAAPGGMVIPDQHMLVYGERRHEVEHLLPPPEAPLPRPVPPPPAPKPQAAPVPASPVPASAAPTPPAPALAKAPTAPPAPPAAPAKPAPAPLRPVIARTGGIRLQLGSVRTPDEARREWQHLKETNADLLGSIDGFAVRADLGAKGIYYRIETAPLADPAVAARICGELKRRGDGCLLDH
jgi:hypothetical protein